MGDNMKLLRRAFPKIGRCDLCKSIFSYTLQDIKYSNNIYNEVYVVCPVCEAIKVVGAGIKEKKSIAE